MELVSRMMDGSIPYDPNLAPRPSPFRFRLGQDDKIDRLQKVPIFAGCSRRQLREIARIADVVEAPAGAALTRVGDPGNHFFLIVDGAAIVEVSPRKRRKLAPGEFFGEMSLLDGGPRSATVVAETPVRLLVIGRESFSVLMREAPDLTRSILITLSRRLRQAEQALNA
jgi:CRP/FNR family transcriptional regulator, cyclic AMP receptor protein